MFHAMTCVAVDVSTTLLKFITNTECVVVIDT